MKAPKKTSYKGHELYSGTRGTEYTVNKKRVEGPKNYVLAIKPEQHRIFFMRRPIGMHFFHTADISPMLEENNGLFEIIESESPRHVYFDCDLTTNCLEQIKTEILKTFPGALMNISGSVTQQKVSYHIVLSNYFFKNVEQQKVLKEYAKINQEFFDPNVYSSDQQFKCVNQRKTKVRGWDDRVQEIIEGSMSPVDHLVVIKGETDGLKNALETLHWLSVDEIINLKKKKKLSGDQITREKEAYESINSEGYSKINFLNLFPANVSNDDKFIIMNYMKNQTYVTTDALGRVERKFTFEDFYNWKKTRGKNDLESMEKWRKNWNNTSTSYSYIDQDNVLFRLKTYLPNIEKEYYEMLVLNDMEFRYDRDIKRIFLEKEDFETDKKFVYNVVHMGGGKTESVIQHSKQYKSVLVVLSRISLINSVFKRLNDAYKNDENDPDKFVHYEVTLSKSLKKYKTQKQKQDYLDSINYDHYVTTINSLSKVSKRDYDLVIVDEFELLLNSYSGSDFLSEKDYDLIVEIFKSSSKVILLDALPSHKSIRMLMNAKLINGISDVFVVGSTVKPPAIPIYKMESSVEYVPTKEKDKFIDYTAENMVRVFAKMIVEDIESGNQVYIFWPRKTARDTKYKDLVSKMNQEEYALYLESIAGRKLNYLVYNSDSTKATKDTLKDVNTTWAGLDFVITGQSITVGVNYQTTKFKHVYLFDMNYVADREIVQTSRRIRTIEKVYYTELSKYKYLKDSVFHKTKNPSYKLFIQDVADEKRGRTFNTLRRSMEKGGFVFEFVGTVRTEGNRGQVSNITCLNDDFLSINFVDNTFDEELLDISLLTEKINFCKLFSLVPSDYKKLWNCEKLAELWKVRRKIKAINSVYPNIYKKVFDGKGGIKEVIEREGTFLTLLEMQKTDGELVGYYEKRISIFLKTLYSAVNHNIIYVLTDSEYEYIKEVIYKYDRFTRNISREKALIKFINLQIGMFFKRRREDQVEDDVIYGEYEIDNSCVLTISKVIENVSLCVSFDESECYFVDSELESE